MGAAQETFATGWSLQRILARSTISNLARVDEMSVLLLSKGGRYERALYGCSYIIRISSPPNRKGAVRN
jgi:hypothetical protein